jgi:hypothetical protein
LHAIASIPADSTIVTLPFSRVITPLIARRALSAICTQLTELTSLSERQLVCIYLCAHWALGLASLDGSSTAAVYDSPLTRMFALTHDFVVPRKSLLHTYYFCTPHTSVHFLLPPHCLHLFTGLRLNSRLPVGLISITRPFPASLSGKRNTLLLLRSSAWLP